MTLNLDIVGKTTVSETPWTWTARNALLYAVSVGAGNHSAIDELALCTENSRGVKQQVLPTYAVVMGMGESEISMSEFGDFPLSRVLHAGQRVVQHAAIPTAGSVVSTRWVSAIYDKGKHALIETVTTFADSGSDELFAESIGQIMVRGEGGFGGDPGPRDQWSAPERPADRVISQRTEENQALIYRLNGDTNPLHSDPSFAQAAGFPRPILHGLCTYGFAARALLHSVADGDASRFGEFSGRFSSPVVPGESLDTHVWLDDGGATFQTRVGDRVVLDRGEFRLRSR